MKLNDEKCEFVITGYRFEHLWLNVGETQVCKKNQVKLLGITIDNELNLVIVLPRYVTKQTAN